MHIAIVYSTPTSRISSTKYGVTDSDTATIAMAVTKGLQANGHNVSIHPLYEKSLKGDILSIRADCIFNLLEWSSYDTPLAAQSFTYLRQLNIPVTGSKEKVYLLSCDKILMKKSLQKLKVPSPSFATFETGKESIPGNITYPLIVKPSLEHCSVGLDEHSIARDISELKQIIKRQIQEFAQPVIAEEYIEGRELLVYLLEDRGKVIILPIEEIFFSENAKYKFQTYSSKWEVNSRDYQSSLYDIAKLTPQTEEVVKQISLRTFNELDFWGYARFDLRLKGNVPYILEVNANPSVYDDEDELSDPNVEIIWGIKFKDYLQTIVETAIYHHSRGELV